MNVPMGSNPPQSSVLAIVSLISGILSWCLFPFFGAIAAVICGHLARGEIRRAAPGTITGDGAALGGLILGWVQLALIALAIFAVFALFGGLAVFSNLH